MRSLFTYVLKPVQGQGLRELAFLYFLTSNRFIKYNLILATAAVVRNSWVGSISNPDPSRVSLLLVLLCSASKIAPCIHPRSAAEFHIFPKTYGDDGEELLLLFIFCPTARL